MPTNVQTTAGTSPVTQYQSSPPTSILGKDDFLKLLTMQLKNQDPLNPMDGTQFASQLAQFSSVEQLSNINATLQQSIDSNYLLSQSISNGLAATFVGKDVRATGDTFHFDGTNPAKMGYSLPSDADTVTVKIYNSSGNLVKTITNTGKVSGNNSFTWDGADEHGNMNPGTYKFTVEAKDANGGTITASSYVEGKVSGVRFKADGTVFIVDGAEVKLADILEIMEG